LTSALEGGEWSGSHPRERAPVTHWIGGWAGPRASLDTKTRTIPSPHWESNP